MATEPVTRVVSLTVDRVDDDNSTKNRDGSMRWKTYANIPELGIVKYPTVLWVDGNRPVQGTTLKAQVTQGDLKRDAKDAGKDYNYWWNIVEWDVGGTPTAHDMPTTHGPEVAFSVKVPSGTPLNDIDRRRAEDKLDYRRKDAIKDAVAALATSSELVPGTIDDLIVDVLTVAQQLYSWEPAEWQAAPVEAPQSPAQPPQQPEAPKGPVQQPDKIEVPVEMTGTQFLRARESVGWTKDKVVSLLRMGVPEWMHQNETDNYRIAWDACVKQWKQDQKEPEEPKW